MALQNSGIIKLSQIQAEFGGTNPIRMSEYYRGLEVPNASQNQSVPTSGTISMSDFYGTVDISFALSLSPAPLPASEYGDITYTTPGTYSFFVPQGVTSISAVVVGAGGSGASGTSSSNGTGVGSLGYTTGGGGGAGGGLSYGTFPVTPGEELYVHVGAGGTGKTAPLNGTHSGTHGGSGLRSYISRSSTFSSTTALLIGYGGSGGRPGLVSSGEAPGGGSAGTQRDGGGNGGNGGSGPVSGTPFFPNDDGAGGGGAGGYSGNGGRGASVDKTLSPTNGSGGGGAGGRLGNNSFGFFGGGVGILGSGSNGIAPGGDGSIGAPFSGAGSGGGQGHTNEEANSGLAGSSFNGRNGGARMVWGSGRSYPSTNVGSSFTFSGDGSYNEGTSITATVTTTSVPDNTTLYWELVLNGSTYNPYGVADFSATSGSFTINSNSGSFSFTINDDFYPDPFESFRINVRTDSPSGTTVLTRNLLINDTSNSPVYALSRSAPNINEGATQTITLTTGGVPNNTTIPYTITGINSNDLSSGSITGNFTISSGSATQSFTMANDFTIEGTETATLTLGSPGSGNISWTINDTSVPTFALSRSAASIYEGSSVDITLTTQGVSDNTVLPYTIQSSPVNGLLHTLNNPNAYGTSAGDRFGISVAISGDRAIVGAYLEDDANGPDAGKAYIFNLATGKLLRTLNNPNAYEEIEAFENDHFGTSVAIDGDYAIVGAPQEDASFPNFDSGKAYIFNLNTGFLVHTLDNPNAYGTGEDDFFGSNVAISGNYAIVGTSAEDDIGGLSSGKAYIFNVTTGALVHTLDNPNAYSTSASDFFGTSVAISDNYAIVGANGEDDAGGLNSGKAYIFNVTTGALVHTLDNPNAYGTSASDFFGRSVAISGDRAIVGAQSEDDAGGSGSGKAYIFNVTTGALVYTLNNPNAYSTSADDGFGDSVAISGNYAIVGAYQEDDTSGFNSGKAYIFNVTTGALVHTLDNPNAYGTSAFDRFSESIAMSDNYAIVGAFLEDDIGGLNSGKAYIYSIGSDMSSLETGTFTVQNGTATTTIIAAFDDLVENTETFTLSLDNGIASISVNILDSTYSLSRSATSIYEGSSVNITLTTQGVANNTVIPYSIRVTGPGNLVHTLDNPNAYGTSANDRFGNSVAIDGDRAIVGAYSEDDASGLDSGKAYIFNTTTGALVRTLDNPNAYGTTASDFFGWSVAISGDRAIVGAYQEDDAGGSNSGKAYIFNVTTGALVHTLDNPNAYGTSANDRFGYAVAISGDRAIVTAYLEDDAGGSNSGKAYIFNVTTGALVHTLDNPNAYSTSTNDFFGFSIAISGDRVIVGANGEDDAGGLNSGKAYIFNVTTGALVHTLDNPNAYGTSASDAFGRQVAIDGNYAIVGASGESFQSGKAYIFNVTTGALVHTLDNPNAYGTTASDFFGYAVAIDGNYAIVGVEFEDDAGGINSGKAYIFNVTTGLLVSTLDNPNAYDTSAGDNFGNSVAISGDRAIVGAIFEDDAGGFGSGKAYIFDIEGDFTDSQNGSFTIQNGTATTTITAVHDNLVENTETLTLSLGNGAGSISVSILAPSFILSRSASNINEGATQTITLTTQGVADNTTIPYTITGVDSSDLSSGSITGNFTVVSGTATQSFTFANDSKLEGTETATLTLSSPGSENISWTINDTSVPTFTLSRSAASIYEGSSVDITLNVVGGSVTDNTNIPYTITGISAGDISESLTGNFTIVNNTDTLTFNAILDSLNESTETATLTLGSPASGSITWQILQPTFTLSRSSASINEGQSQTITLTTIGISDGTTIPYTITGIDSSDLSSGSITGNFTISSGSATRSFTMANDFKTEGTETATLTLNGPGTTISWSIIDTSVFVPPQYNSLTRNVSTVTEGNTVTFTLTTGGIPNGTTVGYTISGTGIDTGDITGALTGTLTIQNNQAVLSVPTRVNDDTILYVLGNDPGMKVKQFNVSAGLQNLVSGTQFSIPSGQGSSALGMYFRDNGSTVWLQDPSTDKFHRYTLSTNFDISTATSHTSASYGTVGTNHQGMWISPAGISLYQVDRTLKYILYDGIFTWDPMSPGAPARFKDISANVSLPTGIAVKADGTRAFISNIGNGADIYEFSGTANRPDLWTVGSSITNSTSVFFTDIFVPQAGTKMYATNESGVIYYYELSTAWNLSTATLIRTVDMNSHFSGNIHAMYLQTRTSETLRLTLNATDSAGNSTGSLNTTVNISG